MVEKRWRCCRSALDDTLCAPGSETEVAAKRETGQGQRVVGQKVEKVLDQTKEWWFACGWQT